MRRSRRALGCLALICASCTLFGFCIGRLSAGGAQASSGLEQLPLRQLDSAGAGGAAATAVAAAQQQQQQQQAVSPRPKVLAVVGIQARAAEGCGVASLLPLPEASARAATGTPLSPVANAAAEPCARTPAPPQTGFTTDHSSRKYNYEARRAALRASWVPPSAQALERLEREQRIVVWQGWGVGSGWVWLDVCLLG